MILLALTHRSSESPMPSVADQMFRTLADPTRRALYERLARGTPQTVHALTALSGVSQPAVSKHLAQLKRAGLVVDERLGRETWYRATPDGLAPLLDWVKRYDRFWNERFDALETLLNEIEP